MWLFALLVSASIFIKKGQYRLLLPLAVPFILSGMLMLSIPAQDPRYILFLIETGLFSLFMAVGCKNKKLISASNKAYLGS